MANYTDIPTGEEQGLVSDTIKSESGKKDTNFYLKLACVGLLCVVAFLSGNVHSRNTVTSMVNSSYVRCQELSKPSGDQCIEIGGGGISCLDARDADDLLEYFNAFSDSWSKVTCDELGYPMFDRVLDLSRSPGYLLDEMGKYGVPPRAALFIRA